MLRLVTRLHSCSRLAYLARLITAAATATSAWRTFYHGEHRPGHEHDAAPISRPAAATATWRQWLQGAKDSSLRAQQPVDDQLAAQRTRHRIIRDLALMLADGDECMSDLEAERHQQALFGAVAADARAFRVIDKVAWEHALGDARTGAQTLWDCTARRPSWRSMWTRR